MRRRPRRSVNNSESTGKIGQELPSNQPRPLVPLYPDDSLPGESRTARPAAVASETRPPRPQAVPQEIRPPRPQSQPRRPAPVERSARQDRAARPEWNEPAGSGRLEMETQPDMPSAPSAEAQAIERSPQAPKGYVVLAIGLP